jgi:transposase
MLKKQMEMILSPYSKIYDLIIPKNNMLREINDMIDFAFIYDELTMKYCLNNGRSAIDPIRMFKYLLLKVIYDLSDVDVVERSRYDMSFKYFLDMAPEEDVINPSSLTKFRKLRLKDTNLLDLLIVKTVEVALEKGIIKSKAIIVDSTHTKARYNQKTPREALLEQSKKLRKSVYEVDETMRKQFPSKVNNGILEDEIDYCKELMSVINQNETVSQYPKVKEKMNLLKELVEDDIEMLEFNKDNDAKVGHKTADTSFFGYKTHIAMTEERIITAAVVTSGEKHDGKQLQTLVQKSRESGMEIKEVIGDAAYSEKDNLKFAKEEKIGLISKLNPTVTHGNRKNEGKFEFNKDAGMYVCPAGHISIKRTNTRPKKHAKDGEGTVLSYFFDVEKCKTCPQKEGCYNDGVKTKSYSVSIKSNTHKDHMDFQETEYFKERAKERYKIEAKNSELKHRHGYDVASAAGLIGMEMQGALTIFAVNLKRILTLNK